MTNEDARQFRNEVQRWTRDTEQLTEMMRQRLSRQITSTFTGSDGTVAALVLDGPVEEMFRRSLREIRQYATETPEALIVPGHDWEAWHELEAVY